MIKAKNIVRRGGSAKVGAAKVHFSARLAAEVAADLRALSSDLGVDASDLFHLLVKIAKRNAEVRAVVADRRRLHAT